MTEAGWRTRSTGRLWWWRSDRWRLCLKRKTKVIKRLGNFIQKAHLRRQKQCPGYQRHGKRASEPGKKIFISFGVFVFHVINKRVTRSQNFPLLPNASSYQLCSTQHLHGYKTRLKSGRKEFVETFPSFYFAMHLNL